MHDVRCCKLGPQHSALLCVRTTAGILSAEWVPALCQALPLLLLVQASQPSAAEAVILIPFIRVMELEFRKGK